MNCEPSFAQKSLKCNSRRKLSLWTCTAYNRHPPASFCSSFSIVLFLLWNCSIIPRSLSTNIRSILACMSAIMASMSSSEAGKFLNIYKDRFEIKNQMEIIVNNTKLTHVGLYRHFENVHYRKQLFFVVWDFGFRGNLAGLLKRHCHENTPICLLQYG